MSERTNFVILHRVTERAQLLAELGELLIDSLKLARPDPPLSPNEPIFGGRFALDSVDAAQWVVSVERRYAVQLSDSDLTEGALESLGALADILVRQEILARATTK